MTSRRSVKTRPASRGCAACRPSSSCRSRRSGCGRSLTVSRYILTHGFQPLAYATVRYGLAVVVFIAITYLVGARSASSGDLALIGGAAAFVYVQPDRLRVRLDKASPSVLGLTGSPLPLAGRFRTESFPHPSGPARSSPSASRRVARCGRQISVISAACSSA
jgi:hypothetical protein